MGVPVMTLAGATHVSRVGVSVLSNVRLGEFIAHTPQEFVKIASSCVEDLPRLAELRAGMRDRLLSSPLMDKAQLTRDIEAAYRQMWHEYCRSV